MKAPNNSLSFSGAWNSRTDFQTGFQENGHPADLQEHALVEQRLLLGGHDKVVRLFLVQTCRSTPLWSSDCFLAVMTK